MRLGLCYEVPRPHSVAPLWMSGRPVTETTYLTTYNTHNRHTSVLPAGFEPAVPADPRLRPRGH